MLALIANLDRSLIRPLALCPRPGPLAEKLAKLNCPVYFAPLGPLKIKHIRRVVQSISLIRDLLTKERIDIVHPDSERDAFVCGLAKTNLPAKMVWHVRLTMPNSLDNWNLCLADGIIGISDGTRSRFGDSAKLQSRYRTIYNGVDCNVFSPVSDRDALRRKLELPLGKFIVSFVGQIKEGKGVFDLTEAMNILHARREAPPILNMIGTTSDQQLLAALKRKYDSYGLASYIKWQGQQQHIHEWMQASDAVILPSHEGAEGMGRVLFEAMACGSIAIASDISGVREAIVPGSGILIPQKTPSAIADAIGSIMDDTQLADKVRREGLNRARSVFDIKIHARNVERFYADLMTK